MRESDLVNERGIIVPLDDHASQELGARETNECASLQVFPLTLELTVELIAARLPAELHAIGASFNPYGANFLRGDALSCFRDSILTVRRSPIDASTKSMLDRIVSAIDAAAAKGRCVRFNVRHC